MSIRFRNFGRPHANDKWATPVRDELISKPRNIYIFEFMVFLVSVVLFIIGGVGLSKFGFGEVWSWVSIGAAFIFLLCALLSALDHIFYRLALSVAAIGMAASCYPVIKHQPIMVILPAGLLLYVISLYYYAPNIRYYNWVKSLGE